MAVSEIKTVGCVGLGMKSIDEANVGDTLFRPSAPQEALAGFRRPQPMVFAGIFRGKPSVQRCPASGPERRR